MSKYLLAIFLSIVSLSTHAQRFWTQDLGEWHLSLNNGVAYINSPNFPDECKYDRAQINFSNDEYVKALWSYVLAASKTKEKLKVVLDHDQSAGADTIVCVILSADAT